MTTGYFVICPLVTQVHKVTCIAFETRRGRKDEMEQKTFTFSELIHIFLC